MVFGTLCTYAIALGALTIFRNVSRIPFSPRKIKVVADYVQQKGEVVRDELRFTNGEGIFAHNKRVVLKDVFPEFSTFEIEELDPLMTQLFWLTEEELVELEAMLAPLELFERAVPNMGPVLRREHRARATRPIINFLSKIPKIRRSQLVEEST